VPAQSRDGYWGRSYSPRPHALGTRGRRMWLTGSDGHHASPRWHPIAPRGQPEQAAEEIRPSTFVMSL
jgi:hypothetical protein